MADTITFTELGLTGTGPVKQTGPKNFVVAPLSESDIANLETDLANKQPLDATLTALAALIATAGFLVQTAENNFTTRIFEDSDSIICNNPDGVSGNPSFEIANSGVTPGNYGGASTAVQFTLLPDGRLSACNSLLISVAISQVFGLQDYLDTLEDSIVSLSENKVDVLNGFANGLEVTGDSNWNGNIILPEYGGTGINNGENTATFAGNLNFANSFTTSGNFPVTYTHTAPTNVIFPPSGTLATLIKTSRTIVADATINSSDSGGIIYCNTSANIEITLPAQSTEVLPVDFSCKIVNRGSGDVRVIKQGSDVFIQGNNIIGQSDEAEVFLSVSGNPNTWVMTGGTPVFPIVYSWYLINGSNASFIICGSIPAHTTFTQAYFRTNSGTISAVLTINNVNITGSMAMTSVANYVSLTAPNIATRGARLGITTSANVASTFAHVTVSGYQRYYLS